VGTDRRRAVTKVLLVLLSVVAAARSYAQAPDTAKQQQRTHTRRAWVLGAVTSLTAHEASHILASYAQGRHPSLRLDKGRPTIFSGINIYSEPHKQLVFSSAGLVTQAVLDELVLDLPHASDSPFKRGMLACGLGTVLFYVTFGRNGAVSDIALIARTSGMSKGEVSLIAGSVAAVHALRFHFDRRFGSLFFEPTYDGRQVRLGFRR
jgi:hypothetical protein